MNIIAGSGGLDINGLAVLGVKRISLGGSVTRAVFGRLRDALEEIRDAGTLELLEGGMTHDGIDKLLVR